MLGFKRKQKSSKVNKNDKNKYRLIDLDEFNKEQQAKIQQIVLAERRKIAWNMLSPRQQQAMKRIITEKRLQDAKQKHR